MNNKAETSVIGKINRYFQEYGLTANIKNTTIVVGVSGGADSVCLLHNLIRLQKSYKWDVHVCHLNHLVRKDGTAQRDAEFVKNLCQSANIPFHYRESNVEEIARQLGIGTEDAGRRERYRFFNEVGEQYSKNSKYYIATGANANDDIETMLMRLMRGTSLDGLSGIQPYTGNVLHPLIYCTRAEIESYIKSKGLVHIEDGTNSEAIYTRNKIRLELIPWIQNNINPNFINTVVKPMQSYKEDSAYMDKQANKAYANCVFYNTPNQIVFVRRKFMSVDIAIRKRIMMRAIKTVLGTEVFQFNVGAVLDDACKVPVTGKTYTVNKFVRIKVSKSDIIVENTQNMF
jgi:tRNA(Ile)-lysidine synthase